jgi:hypothetical protein
MGIATEPAEKLVELLVDHGVVADGVHEIGFLRLAGQLAVEQQVAELQIVGLLGQLLDGVSPVQQDALVAVDVRDGRFAGGRRDEARI